VSDKRSQFADAPVVITGMGLVTSLGLTAEDSWQAVKSGRCGMGPMSAMESPLPEGSQGGQAPDLPAEFEPDLPREARYLRWTIQAALHDAGVADRLPADGDRCALMLGTTLHGMRAAGRFFRSNDFAELKTFPAGETLRLATSGLGLHGSAATTCSACSSSLGSIALAVTMLQSGEADLVIAGGYDAISEYAWGGFNALRLVAPGPLLPFTRGRRGMKLGEGYGIVVLERAADARRHGARTIATIAGWGESADAHHLTQPQPQGEGALRAMREATQRANIAPNQLDLIAAHATGTPDNDAAEHAALAQLLGDSIADKPVVCFKSHLGHTLGGAGAAELILSVLALRDGMIPACANVQPDQLEFPNLRVTHTKPTSASIRHTLNISLGFGGANTCIVLSRTPPQSAQHVAAGRSPNTKETWITGIGIVLPGAIGNEQFVSKLHNPSSCSSLIDADFEQFLSARRVRRMSAYVKFTLAAATLACRDAAIADTTDLLADTAAILGTMHGASGYCNDYYAQIVREGVLAANPMLFAEGVPNVGAAQLSLMLGLKRACQSIIGTRTAGLDALRLAWLRIVSGAADRVIVGGGEEVQGVVEGAYASCGLIAANGEAAPPFGKPTGFRSTAGAVCLVVESSDAARARGAKPYAVIDCVRGRSGEREMLPRTMSRLLESLPAERNIISSANGTWIDRAELAALSRSKGGTSVGCAYDAFGETWSASPLVAIAAALLTRELPPLHHPPPATDNVSWSTRGRRIDRFTALCSDFSGACGAANLRLPAEPRDHLPTGT
jgi:3-oxoacyl-[acyl-carrier-protein] synthase II